MRALFDVNLLIALFQPDHARRIDKNRILGPKQLTDIYLLALAVKNGGRLVTFDKAIPVGAVRSAEPRHIVVI